MYGWLKKLTIMLITSNDTKLEIEHYNVKNGVCMYVWMAEVTDNHANYKQFSKNSIYKINNLT